MRNLLLLVALITPLSQQSFAASFDCKKATFSTEKLICSSTELGAMDSEMASLYREIAHASMPLEARKLRANQKNWLKERNQCSNKDCLKKSLQDRISSLQKEQERFRVYSRNEDGKRVNAAILNQYPFLNQYIQELVVDTIESEEVSISIHEQTNEFLVVHGFDLISSQGAGIFWQEFFVLFEKQTGREVPSEEIMPRLASFERKYAVKIAQIFKEGGNGCGDSRPAGKIKLTGLIPSRQGLGLFREAEVTRDHCTGPFYLDWKTAQPFLSESGVKVMRSFTQ